MKKYLNEIGLLYSDEGVSPYSYKPEDYKQNLNKDKSEAHRDYLKSIETEESNRLLLIENKTSQLISQTGIIFSLLSLFVPILIDKVSDLNFIVKLILLILLILSFCFYMLTIRNALKNFKVSNFIYSKPSPNNVLNFQNEKLEEFYAVEVRDLLFCINENLKTNNKKATNLIHSYNSFSIGNTFTGILVAYFSIVVLFFIPQKEGIEIQKPINIDNLDSSLKEIINVIKLKSNDTIYFRSIEKSNLKNKLPIK